MSSLSILMLTNLFPPVVSGSSTQSAALSRELARRGHRVRVITARMTPDDSDHEEVDGYHVDRLPALRLPRMGISFNFPWLSYTFTPANLPRIAAIVREHEPAVLHLHNHMFDLALSAVLMRRRFKVPLAITIHTMVKHANRLYDSLLRPADRILLRSAIIASADAILSPDLNVQRYVEAAFGRYDSRLVPYGVSMAPEPNPQVVQHLRARHALQGRRVVLSLGHVNENRNRRDLLCAFPAVLSRVPDAVLVIVGTEGTDLPRRLARDLGIERSVVFTGAVPHAEVPAFLAMAELEGHWLNQDEPERTSLGIASLEAMGAGLPIVAAANLDTYGAGLLKDRVNLLLARPDRPAALARTLIELLEDPALRRTIGANASRTVRENFSWDSVCERTLDAYQFARARRRPVTS